MSAKKTSMAALFVTTLVATMTAALPAQANTTVTVGQNGSGQYTSISKAVREARPGTTILVKDGVYHEAVNIWKAAGVDNDITIKAAEGAKPVLDGSRAYTAGFTKQADGTFKSTSSIRMRDGSEFNRIGGHDDTTETGDLAFADDPVAYDPSQIIVGGKHLKQVADGKKPGPGEFTMEHWTKVINKGTDDEYTQNHANIILGENPGANEVRYAYLPYAIWGDADNVDVDGLTIRGYATPINLMGTVYTEGQDIDISNMRFENLPTVAVNIAGQAHRGVPTKGSSVTNSTFVESGMQAIGAYYAKDLVVSGNTLLGSNAENFRSQPVAAGVKITSSEDVTVSKNTVKNTKNSSGIWLDESNHKVNITDNIVEGSGANGIHFEISAVSVISGNTIRDSKGHGIELMNSPKVKIENNIIENSGHANIGILQDRRPIDLKKNPRYMGWRAVTQNNAEQTWITKDVSITGNTLGDAGTYQIDSHDRNHGKGLWTTTRTADMVSSVTANRFVGDSDVFARIEVPGSWVENGEQATGSVLEVGFEQFEDYPFADGNFLGPGPVPGPEPEPVGNTKLRYMDNEGKVVGEHTMNTDPGDVILMGDWNGDGKITPGVKKTGTNRYELSDELDGSKPQTVIYGQAGDLPVVGDWDSDGKDTLGLRRSYSQWFLTNSPEAKTTDIYHSYFGERSATPLVGNWDGKPAWIKDGKILSGGDSLGHRESNYFTVADRLDYPNSFQRGVWYGAANDKPVVGDWDKDGQDEIGIVRDGRVHIANEAWNGLTLRSVQVGEGDIQGWGTGFVSVVR